MAKNFVLHICLIVTIGLTATACRKTHVMLVPRPWVIQVVAEGESLPAGSSVGIQALPKPSFTAKYAYGLVKKTKQHATPLSEAAMEEISETIKVEVNRRSWLHVAGKDEPEYTLFFAFGTAPWRSAFVKYHAHQFGVAVMPAQSESWIWWGDATIISRSESPWGGDDEVRSVLKQMVQALLERLGEEGRWSVPVVKTELQDPRAGSSKLDAE